MKTLDGAAVQGAFVRVIELPGHRDDSGSRAMVGRFRFLLFPPESYEIVIDGPKQGFEFQIHLGILQNSAAHEKCVFIRGESGDFVHAGSVLDEKIKQKRPPQSSIATSGS